MFSVSLAAKYGKIDEKFPPVSIVVEHIAGESIYLSYQLFYFQWQYAAIFLFDKGLRVMEDIISKDNKTLTTLIIHSPMNGRASDLSAVPDDKFSAMMLGKGACILPGDGLVCSPEDGYVELLFDTKHAVGIKTEEGIGILIHCGVDTIKLQGKGFEAYVQQGQRVKAGDPLIKVDLDLVRKFGFSAVTAVVDMDIQDNQTIRVLTEGDIKAGDPLFAIDTLYEAES